MVLFYKYSYDALHRRCARNVQKMHFIISALTGISKQVIRKIYITRVHNMFNYLKSDINYVPADSS